MSPKPTPLLALLPALLVSHLGCALEVKEALRFPQALAGLQCIAVLPFENLAPDYHAGDVVADLVAGSLTTSGHYNIVEPAEVRLILDAQGVPYRPPSSTEAARNYGQALGVEAVFTGTVSRYPATSGSPAADGKPVVDLAASLVEVKTGQVVWRGKAAHAAQTQALSPDPGIELTSLSVDGLLSGLEYERSDVVVHRSVCAKRPSLLALERQKREAEGAARASLALQAPTPALPGEAGGTEALPALPPEGAGGGLPPLPGEAPSGSMQPGAGIPGLPPVPGGSTPDLPQLPEAGAPTPASGPETLPYTVAAPEAAPKATLKLTGRQKKLLQRLYAAKAQIQRLFVPGTTKLNAQANALFADLGRLLQAVPDLKLAVEVHVDLGGAGAHSEELANKQASALQQAFESKVVHAKGRLFYRPVGSREPLAKDKSKRARLQNSRVEMQRIY